MGFFDLSLNRWGKNYTILREEDILRRVEDDITEVATVLSVSRFAASMLLHRHKWSVTTVHEAWFADEERARVVYGLLDKPPADNAVKFPDGSTSDQDTVVCLICFESCPLDEVKSTAACSHWVCVTCWQRYISTFINDGLRCLALKCPDPSCKSAVGQDMVDLLASEKDRVRFHGNIIRSFVEGNKRTKWCPFPGCGCAIELDAGSESYDLNCLCSHSFCWNCMEEAHRPVDCDTRAKWILRSSDEESKNKDWMITRSKPCPECKKPIEKNQGCNHMVCMPPCNYQFCWICLLPWSGHSNYFWCNQYNKGQNRESVRREKAKEAAERDKHYFERWEANISSSKRAIADLHEMQTVKIKEISKSFETPEPELKFVVEAWLHIIEYRRILAWTYMYGYYLPIAELTKKDLFEFLQRQAEANLERLHQCVEMEVQANLLEKHIGIVEFADFRSKLVHLTRVTRNHFEKLVSTLQDGLPDINSLAEENKQEKSMTAGQSHGQRDSRGSIKKGKKPKSKNCDNGRK
ncbi:hypothetical protein RJ640_008848 [Escallonia rubra]|uniref:RBR-type E3 ubiquitin transferase n=1 Tax=Escallonia rubra TaxID=112253 RepID=A0AA88RNU6_9ASTE|nr:hypothetical protein RJ640_008848 [Escallonia rubra]